jgi:hypothetical protein
LKSISFIWLLFFLCFSTAIYAQGPPTPCENCDCLSSCGGNCDLEALGCAQCLFDCEQGIPINSGISYLFVLAVMFGVQKILASKTKEKCISL